MQFDFKELILTAKVFDLLGFSEYWAGASEFGSRSLNLAGHNFRIQDIDTLEAGYEGWGYNVYEPQHFTSEDFQTTFHFLHDIYEYIVKTMPSEAVSAFIEKAACKELAGYLSSYQAYISEQSK